MIDRRESKPWKIQKDLDDLKTLQSDWLSLIKAVRLVNLISEPYLVPLTSV